MADSTDLTDAITQNAASPNSATSDGVTVTQNPPSEPISNCWPKRRTPTRHWNNADNLSANASNTQGTRRILRNRSRYEAGSNSLYAGVLRTIADHTIGTSGLDRAAVNGIPCDGDGD
jgi:hypothetical protein